MIATSRRMPIHDFLLVAFSVAVVVLSNWPETQPRQWVQLRKGDGTLQQYSLAESDPQVAKLRLALEKWLKAGQETRLAVAQWRVELAELYASKTETAPPPSSNPIRAVSFRGGTPPSEPATDAAAALAAERLQEQAIRSQHEYWLQLGRDARAEIGKIAELRRSRKALEVPPPIVFGRLEPGGTPRSAILLSALIGTVVACLFAAWAYCFPMLLLCQPSAQVASLTGEDSSRTALSPEVLSPEIRPREFRLVVPSAWVRVRQPAGVVVRWVATGGLVVAALTSVLL